MKNIARLDAKRHDKEYERIAAASGESVLVVVLRDYIAHLERRLAKLEGRPWVDCRGHIPSTQENKETSVNCEDSGRA